MNLIQTHETWGPEPSIHQIHTSNSYYKVTVEESRLRKEIVLIWKITIFSTLRIKTKPLSKTACLFCTSFFYSTTSHLNSCLYFLLVISEKQLYFHQKHFKMAGSVNFQIYNSDALVNFPCLNCFYYISTMARNFLIDVTIREIPQGSFYHNLYFNQSKWVHLFWDNNQEFATESHFLLSTRLVYSVRG